MLADVRRATIPPTTAATTAQDSRAHADEYDIRARLDGWGCPRKAVSAAAGGPALGPCPLLITLRNVARRIRRIRIIRHHGRVIRGAAEIFAYTVEVAELRRHVRTLFPGVKRRLILVFVRRRDER
jgi:hypothetical protein